MPLMLKSGFSKQIVQANMRLLINDGFSRSQSIVQAFNSARASYFKAHPQGALPEWLAYPKDRRLSRFYLPNGAPLKNAPRAHTETNPVRELDIDNAELSRIRNEVQKQMTGQGRAVRKAAALYTEFTGHDDPRLTKIAIPSIPQAALAIGEVDGIMYSTVRDGVPEKYVHKFKRSSRPLMISSPDGKQLYLIGGSYDFTERGIVDK